MSALLWLMLWLTPGAGSEVPVVVETGPSRVVGSPTGRAALFPLEDLRYQIREGILPQSLRLDRGPQGISPGARWGVLHLESGFVAYVIDADDAGGYRCWIDGDRDGDLSEEEARPLQRSGSWLELDVPESVLGDAFELALPLGDNGLPMDYVRERMSALRGGTVEIGGKPLLFALRATAGAWARGTLFFDLDGNGRIDEENERSDEAFRASERFFNIDGRSYTFSVDPDGRRLRLSPLAEPRPERVPIDPGNPAPDFVFRDLDGSDRSLSDFRGKVVLLFFWHAGCERCARTMPRVAEVYEAYRDLSFEVIGITEDADPGLVVATRAAAGAFWSQAVEPAGSPLFDVYRVDAMPTFVLIDIDGVILTSRLRPDRLAELLEPLLISEMPLE